MIRIVKGDLLSDKSDVLVNTVNCVGVMGKGIALQFKNRYPQMFSEYKAACSSKKVKAGQPYMYQDTLGTKILNFPTKDHWREKTKMSYVENGIRWIEENFAKYSFQSMAIPALGCGNGGLDWVEVGPYMYDHLKDLPLDITIYAPYNATEDELDVDYLKSHKPSQQKKPPKIVLNPKWMLILKVMKSLDGDDFIDIDHIVYQKICYMLTRGGLETDFTFEKKVRGPYSIKAKNAMEKMKARGLINENTELRIPILTVTDLYYEDDSIFSDKELRLADNVIELFKRMKSTEQAEIAATIVYSFDDLNKESTPDKKALYSYIFSWKKGWSNKRDEIEEVMGWLGLE